MVSALDSSERVRSSRKSDSTRRSSGTVSTARTASNPATYAPSKRRASVRRPNGRAAVSEEPVVGAACGNSAPATKQASSLTGAGATFPAPLYQKWASDYEGKAGVQINYQAIGSGGGIAQITAKTVDFGASDAPMKDDELTKA